MRKNLSAIGNGMGIVIEKSILELLYITRDIELEAATVDPRMIIEPVRTKETVGRRGRVGRRASV